MTGPDLPDWARRLLANQEIGRPRWPAGPSHYALPLAMDMSMVTGASPSPSRITGKKAIPKPTDAQIQRKLANFKLVADALEFLLQIQPTIPGASVTLTPAQQDELQRIVLALPASVEL